MQTNRLRALGDGEDGGSALHALTTLEELYLAHNAITQLGGAVRTLGALDTLDLTGNRLTSLDGSQHLTSLTEFWCSSNHIPTFEALAPASDALGATLSCIYLEHNPLAKEYDYRQRVAALFPARRDARRGHGAGRRGFGGRRAHRFDGRSLRARASGAARGPNGWIGTCQDTQNLSCCQTLPEQASAIRARVASRADTAVGASRVVASCPHGKRAGHATLMPQRRSPCEDTTGRGLAR